MLEFIEKIQYKIYFVSISLLYVIYFLLFTGIYDVSDKYVHYLTLFVHIFICGFLVIKFNPFIHTKFNPNDSMVIFGAAIALLTNVVLSEMNINTNQILKNVSGAISSFTADINSYSPSP